MADLAYALRQLRANPGFAAASVLTLALGIGANAAIYQVLDAVVFRSLPVREPQQLVQVQLLDNGSPVHVSYPLFREMAARQQVLDGIFAVSEFPLREAVLRGRGSLRAVRGVLVTGNYFHVLGVPARLGRVFTEEDDRAGALPVAVISHAFWEREFGLSAGALGQTLQINQASATIIGIAPPQFFGETVGSAPDVWLPIAFQPQVMPADWLNAPANSWLAMLARLRPGIAARQAQPALDALYRQLAALNSQTTGHEYRVELAPASRGIAQLEARFARPLWVIAGVVGLVLLIACLNLANLLLGRATARTHEFGVRLAVGAARARLVRQLLTESLVLSALGTAAALPLASYGSRALVTLASAGENWQLPLTLGWRVLLFTAAVAVPATCLFGLAPALAATRVDVHSALQANRRHSRSRGTHTLGRLLVVAQLSVSLVLLSGAALLARSLWNLRHQDFGYHPEGVLVADLPLEFTRAMMARNTALRQPLYERLNALPGVRSAAVSGFGPLGSVQHTTHISTPGRPTQKDDFTRLVHVSSGYFETMRIPMVAGRTLSAQDRKGSPKVVVLGETVARTLFGNSNPVGRMVSTSRVYDANETLQVAGVARDVRFGNPREPFGFVLYVPMDQDPAPVTAAVLRVAGPPAALIDTGALIEMVRAAVREIDPNLRVAGVRPLMDLLDSKLGTEKMLAILSFCFGALTLVLVTVGVYGVVSYAVQRRTQEIGIRLALGAARGTVSRMMMRDLAPLLGAGALFGGVGAYAITRAMHSILFGFVPDHYATLVAAALLLFAVGALAAYVPARRAARMDPLDALRQE